MSTDWQCPEQNNAILTVRANPRIVNSPARTECSLKACWLSSKVALQNTGTMLYNSQEYRHVWNVSTHCLKHGDEAVFQTRQSIFGPFAVKSKLKSWKSLAFKSKLKSPNGE